MENERLKEELSKAIYTVSQSVERAKEILDSKHLNNLDKVREIHSTLTQNHMEAQLKINNCIYILDCYS